MAAWELVSCLDEWYLPGQCTIPIAILYVCILLFFLGLIMVFIVGLSPKNRHFEILVRLFSLTIIQTPLSLWVREINHFFIIKEHWERILLVFAVITTLVLSIFAQDAFVIINLLFLIIITIYFFVTNKKNKVLKWKATKARS